MESLEKSSINCDDLELQITELIRLAGIPAHVKGYAYLRTAILIVLKDFSAFDSVTKILYPQVAKIYQTTASKVERAIRHAIEIAWNKGDLDVLSEMFGSAQKACVKPTNSEFIALISDNLRLKTLSKH